jgi:hypothetical protein
MQNESKQIVHKGQSAANRAKSRWNAANYVQVKANVQPGIATAFKTACATAGVSMAGELARFMTEYATLAEVPKPAKRAASPGVLTKKKRSDAVSELICKLVQVREAEEEAMENTPENLRGSANFEASEERIPLMDEAIEILGSLY